MNAAPCRVAARSSVGRRVRQEDAHFVRAVAGEAFLAVADGMGGHAAGEIASGFAIKAMQVAAGLLDQTADPIALLQGAARVANLTMLDHVQAHPESRGLGSTLVTAVVRKGRLFVAHAGDSRAWLLAKDECRLLTRDHSAVQEALDRGEITPDEAAHSPYRQAILRYLGDATFQGLEISSPPDGWVLESGCVVLLTSDGAHSALTDAQVLDQMSGTADLETGLEHLVRLSFANGSDDNITLAACEFGSYSRSRIAARVPPAIPASRRARLGQRGRIRRPLLIVLAAIFAFIHISFVVLVVREVRPELRDRDWDIPWRRHAKVADSGLGPSAPKTSPGAGPDAASVPATKPSSVVAESLNTPFADSVVTVPAESGGRVDEGAGPFAPDEAGTASVAPQVTR